MAKTAKTFVSETKPDSRVAVVLIDVINHFEFPDGDKLLRNALPIAPRLAKLKQKARDLDIPVIYVNDNFGHWRSNASKLLEYCLRPESPSRKFVEAIRPDDKDYLILKPKHSAFYQTPLDTLLGQLGVKSLVFGGIATNSCVLCSTHDANMRDLKIYVPADCCSARTRPEHLQAIKHLEMIPNVDVSPSAKIPLESLRKN